jgi:hypothetical protein
MDHHPPRSSRVLCPRIAEKFASFAKKEIPVPTQNLDLDVLMM